MKKLLASAILLGLAAPQVATAAEEVNVYSYRQPFLVEPMFNEFTKETGIKVNVKFAKKKAWQRNCSKKANTAQLT